MSPSTISQRKRRPETRIRNTFTPTCPASNTLWVALSLIAQNQQKTALENTTLKRKKLELFRYMYFLVFKETRSQTQNAVRDDRTSWHWKRLLLCCLFTHTAKRTQILWKNVSSLSAADECKKRRRCGMFWGLSCPDECCWLIAVKKSFHATDVSASVIGVRGEKRAGRSLCGWPVRRPSPSPTCLHIHQPFASNQHRLRSAPADSLLLAHLRRYLLNSLFYLQ